MAESISTPALPPLSLEINTQVMDSANVSTAQPSPSASNPLPPHSTTMPEISITFLLISGRRRTLSFASSTSIGRVKELVWNSWPADWSDERPPAPNYLRVLYLGKMLQDEEVLDCGFGIAVLLSF
jgi:Ubiquitin-2 like Rad60 SUMO-like